MVDNKKEYSKKYYQKHREERLEYGRKYYQDNKEERKEYDKEYKKGNPKKVKQWRNKWNRNYINNNPEKVRAYDYNKYYKQRKHFCELCGLTYPKLHFHHTNYEENEGFTVCVPCHKALHSNNKFNEKV